MIARGREGWIGACLFSVALGCSSAAGPSPSLTASVPTPSPEPDIPHAREPISLRAIALPQGARVDGDLAEWGTAPGRNELVIGVGRETLVLAIGWADPKRPEVYAALASSAPSVPDIGWSERGGGTHPLTEMRCELEQIPLVEGMWRDGKQQPPEVVKACLEVLGRHQKMSAAYRDRFIRRLKLGAEGASRIDATGTTEPIPNAKVAASMNGVEIQLPLSALPELAQAPLASLFVGASFGALPEGLRMPPDEIEPDPAWKALSLDAPVGFGPRASLLEALFKEPAYPPNLERLSYAPDKPERLHFIAPSEVAVAPVKSDGTIPGAIGGATALDRPAVYEEERPLFTKLDSFGDVEIGSTSAKRELLVTFVGGRLVATDPFARPQASIRRGDDLHLIRLDAGGFSWSVGFYQPPAWQVRAIHLDGTIEDIAGPGDMAGVWSAWDGEPKSFSDKDWQRFGLRGKRNGKPKTVTWQWSPKEGRYDAKITPASQARYE